MTHANITPELLDRYLAGDATADERGAVDRWIGTDAARADLVSALGRAAAPDTERWLAHVNARRAAEAQRVPGSTRRPIRPGAIIRWGVGAALAAAALWAVGMQLRSRTVPEQGRTYATATGQRAVVTLADGTRITLAPQSTLRVPAFDRAHRTVVLDGEAYFDVSRVASAPFTVRTGGVSARVLGTRFNVRHYGTDTDARVAVVSGKVGVTAVGQRREAVVTAGQVAVATDSTTVTAAMTDAASYTGWVDGALVFRDAPAATVFAALSRWYGYDVRLADSTLASRTLTIALSTRSSADALSALKLVLNVDITFDGNHVTLTPRRTSRASGHDRDMRSTSPLQREVGR